MNIKTISVALVAVMVGAVMFGALIPIFDDVTATEDTFSNVGDSYAYMTKLDATSDYTFEWDHTKPTVAVVNNEEVTLFKGTVFCSSGSFLIRYGQDSAGYYLQVVPSGPFNLGPIYSAGTNTADLSLIISGGTVTGTRTLISDSTETTKTTSITDGFAIAPTGNYVMKKPTQTAYMNSDSVIYAMGLSYYANSGYNGIQIDGDVESVTIDMFTPIPANATFSDVSINADEITSHVDLYGFDSITFKATPNDTTYQAVDLTYNYVIVPAEVTAERAVHVTESEGAIMDLIPLIIGLGLVLMTVAFFLRKKL